MKHSNAFFYFLSICFNFILFTSLDSTAYLFTLLFEHTNLAVIASQKCFLLTTNDDQLLYGGSSSQCLKNFPIFIFTITSTKVDQFS